MSPQPTDVLARDAAAAPTMGRRERRKIATRSELVRAGRQLFGAKGIYESRIEDLAERAGIAKGTVYLYFRSKEELVQAVVEAGFEDLARHVYAAVEGGRTLPDRIARIVDAHLEFFAANTDLMRVFHQARGVLLFGREEWLPLRRPLARHVERIARWLDPARTQRSLARQRVMGCLVFAVISGATSVRAALAGKPSSGVSTATLRRGTAALAAELANPGTPTRRRREGRRR